MLYPDSRALVVLSGGQDSTTCLFWALANFKEVRAITFNYGQRHELELEAASVVAGCTGVPHTVVDVQSALIGTSPLTDHSRPVGHYDKAADMPGGVEPTFVPGRNILFLTIAANHAFVHNCDALVTGVCEEDFGGYPDCRANFIFQMEQALNSGLYGEERPQGMAIHTPLMHLTKAETCTLARDLGPECWEALAFTHTCYDGEYPPNPRNHASILRAKGFREAELPDPLIQRCIRQGLLPADYPVDGLVVEA